MIISVRDVHCVLVDQTGPSQKKCMFLSSTVIYYLTFYSVDSIVCLDACFTQKRHKSQGNSWVPPCQHPKTVFVPVDESEKMEATVEEICPSRPLKASEKTATS